MLQLSKIQTIYQGQFRVADSVQDQLTGVTIPVIQGQTSIVDHVSKNGYRYKRGFWDKVLNTPAAKELINMRDSLGAIEHPDDDDEYMRTPYEKAATIVLKAWVDEGGNPWAHLGLLNNPHGNAIKALVDVGHMPRVSTRGLGNSQVDTVSEFIDPDNYMFLTWDIVRNPNFTGCKMDKVTDSLMKTPVFHELVQKYELRDSVDEHYPRQKLLADIERSIAHTVNLFNQLKNQ